MPSSHLQPCPRHIYLPWHGTFAGKSWRRANTIMAALDGASSGVVVNLGAKWNPFNTQEFAHNDDPAWSLTFAVEALHAIGFEASEKAYNATLTALRRSRAAWWAVDRGARDVKLPAHEDPPELQARLFGRVQLFNERVHPSTICARLARALSERGAAVARRLPILLLKVDIDSFDLPLTEAILRCPEVAASRPRVVYVEINSFVPLAIRFAALPPPAAAAAHATQSTRTPSYGGAAMSGKSNKWPCYGASLSAWEEMMRGAGYKLAATSRALTNAIFVDESARSHPPAPTTANSSSVWCHAGPVDTRGVLERRSYFPRERFATDLPEARRMDENASAVNLATALRTISERCAATDTPYDVGLCGT